MMKKKCNDCGKEVPEDSVFCQYCGSKNIVVIPEKQEEQRSFKKCMDCGRELPEDSKFCQYCGSSNVVTGNVPKAKESKKIVSLNPYRLSDIKRLLIEKGVNLEEKDYLLYGNMFEILAELTHHKLDNQTMVDAFDELSDLVLNKKLSFAAFILKGQEYKTQIRYMNEMGLLQELSDEEKEAFAFCVWQANRVFTTNENGEMVTCLSDFDTYEHIKLLYDEDREMKKDAYPTNEKKNTTISNAQAEFGFSADNPICTTSIREAYTLIDGIFYQNEHVKISARSSVKNSNGNIIDQYKLETPSGQNVTIYIDSYAYENSKILPAGFSYEMNITNKESKENVLPESKIQNTSDQDKNMEEEYGRLVPLLLSDDTRNEGYTKLEKLFNIGYSEAGVLLGQRYSGVDREKSRKFFSVPAKENNAEALWGLANCLPHNFVPSENNEQDQEWVKTVMAAAQLRCPDAMNEAGNIENRRNNYYLSAYWYGMAELYEHPEAIHGCKGIAKRWIADGKPGIPSGLENDPLYVQGKYMIETDAEDRISAINSILDVSKSKNYPGLSLFAAKIYESQFNNDMAAKMYQKATLEGDLQATRAFADMLVTGTGCKQEKEKAFILYENAARRGDKICCFVMGEFERNKGNVALANAWYAKSLARGYDLAAERIRPVQDNNVNSSQNTDNTLGKTKSSTIVGNDKKTNRFLMPTIVEYETAKRNKKTSNDVVALFYDEKIDEIAFVTFTMFDKKSIEFFLDSSDGKAISYVPDKDHKYWLLISETDGNVLMFRQNESNEKPFEDIDPSKDFKQFESLISNNK